MKLKFLDDFRKDEQGGILAFYLIMFMVMMIGGGMAVDFVRHEIKREGLQDALDRGVLAAAGSAQASAPSTAAEYAAAEAGAILTVRSYIITSGFDPDEQGLVVNPNITAFSQRVDANANFDVDTYFLRLTGIDTLSGVAAAGAAVSVNQIELSLIVDVSGSMRGDKIINLRAAATQFTNLMLQGDRSLNTSISLVPFSGQVSATTSMMASYNYNRWHAYSNCVDFEASDYTSTALPSGTTASEIAALPLLAQTQHFAPEWIWNRDSDWCPRSELQITPFSNSTTDLNAAITALHATGQTAAQIGMKWGVALLDESSQNLVTNLITLNKVDPTFAGRPGPYGDIDVLKFAILMTDGANTDQYNIKDKAVDYERYKTFEVIKDALLPIGVFPNYNAPMAVIDDNWDGAETLVEASGQRNADYWDSVRTPWTPWTTSEYLSVRVGSSEEDARLQSICTAAKNSGIVVFTIGYDVNATSNAATQMRDCASTAGHFYNVETTDLAAAFSSIYQTIQKLKLVN